MGYMQGFCWPLSVAPGETIRFYTATTSTEYQVRFVYFNNRPREEVSVADIHNGSELVEIQCGPELGLPGHTQPAHPSNTHCDDWTLAFTLKVPEDWSSGIYAAKCVDQDEHTFFILFIVNPTTERRSRLLLLANVNTWNAYNPWGGYEGGNPIDGSRYSDSTGTGTIYSLSFLRPNAHAFNSAIPDGANTPLTWTHDSVPYTSRHLARGELWLSGWLIDQGYEFDVYTDLDFHAGISDLEEYDAIILSTHPEYWSPEMYDRLESYLDGGGNLLYLGANGIYDAVDISDDFTRMTFYGSQGVRDRLMRKTARPDGVLRHEARLLGVASYWTPQTGDTGINTPSREPYAVEDEAHPFFADTNVQNGDLFGDEGWCIPENGAAFADGGASGWESDGWRLFSSDSPDYRQLARGTNTDTFLDDRRASRMVVYRHPGGGIVFSAGSMTVQGALPVDDILTTIVRNVLNSVLA